MKKKKKNQKNLNKNERSSIKKLEFILKLRRQKLIIPFSRHFLHMAIRVPIIFQRTKTSCTHFYRLTNVFSVYHHMVRVEVYRLMMIKEK